MILAEEYIKLRECFRVDQYEGEPTNLEIAIAHLYLFPTLDDNLGFHSNNIELMHTVVYFKIMVTHNKFKNAGELLHHLKKMHTRISNTFREFMRRNK